MSLQYQLPEEGGYGSIVCRFHINCDAASLQTLQSLPGDTFQLALWQQDQLSRTLYIFLLFLHSKMIFPDGSSSKKSACNAGDSGLIPGSGRSPGEGNGNPLRILAWRIPQTEEPGGLQSTGSQRVRHD